MTTVDTQSPALYIRRATDFYGGMDATDKVGVLPQSTALLAIHSAISYADALRIGLGDDKLSGDNHRQSADKLEKLLKERRELDLKGIKHLQELLKLKTSVAYGKKRLDERAMKQTVSDAQRFAAWASRIGTALGLEGWRND